MKKILTIMFALMFMISPAVVFGAAQTLDSDNTTIGDGSHANGGPDLTFNVSPNVEMSVYVTTTDYAITSANTQTDTDNGMEYGVLSTSTGYAQRQKSTDKTEGPETVTSATSLPSGGGTWAWMGGSGGS